MRRKFKYYSHSVTWDGGTKYECVLNHCYILKVILKVGHSKCECAGSKLVFVLAAKGSVQQVDCFVV